MNALFQTIQRFEMASNKPPAFPSWKLDINVPARPYVRGEFT